MSEIVSRIRYVKLKDYLAGIKFLMALPFSYLLKWKRPHIWLICEDENEARDNGYCFFKYLRREHPEIDAVYAINKKSPDFEKVNNLGQIISYGKFTHWIYYLAAEYNISSQKGGKPNAAICYFLEIYGFWKNKRIFLQHGIIKDDAKWLYYDVTKMRCFICGAKPEYEYVKSVFGYPDGYVRYTGLARYDYLHENIVVSGRILIMPTWREWLQENVVKGYDGNNEVGSDFVDSDYYHNWDGLLKSMKLNEYVEKYDLEVIFYPHRNMQPYLENFKSNNTRIKIADWKEYDVQNLLKTSQVLITDYSSVFFDFAYMKKPVIFYQFDEEIYRKYQYQQGWFSYGNNSIGRKVKTKDEVMDALYELIEKKFQNNDDAIYGHERIFPLYDMNNCKRIYDVVREI